MPTSCAGLCTRWWGNIRRWKESFYSSSSSTSLYFFSFSEELPLCAVCTCVLSGLDLKMVFKYLGWDFIWIWICPFSIWESTLGMKIHSRIIRISLKKSGWDAFWDWEGNSQFQVNLSRTLANFGFSVSMVHAELKARLRRFFNYGTSIISAKFIMIWSRDFAYEN